MVTLGVTCEPDSQYPSIINSTKHVLPVTLTCGHKVGEGDNAFYITPFDEVNNIILSADSVGLAVALQRGTSFKVVRFSLFGSTRAIEMMRMVAEIAQRSSSGSATPRNLSSEEVL